MVEAQQQFKHHSLGDKQRCLISTIKFTDSVLKQCEVGQANMELIKMARELLSESLKSIIATHQGLENNDDENAVSEFQHIIPS